MVILKLHQLFLFTTASDKAGSKCLLESLLSQHTQSSMLEGSFSVISSLPFVIIIIIISKCCPMWYCTSSAPLGVLGSIKDTYLGCISTVGNPGHLPAFLQMQEEEGH